MTDSNCIFCKIAGGEIPSATVYEDSEFRVILDLGPASIFVLTNAAPFPGFTCWNSII